MKRKSKVILFFVVGLLITLGFWLYESGLMINITGSMPRGIYWQEKGVIKRGDVVAFCLSEKNQQLGLSRGYLIHGMRCQRGEPLIKKVIAVPGDTVMLSKKIIKVNGQTFPYPTLSKDSHDRPLNAYPAGSYFNTKDYWVIGTDSTRSWDSRYFGPIPAEALLWKIKPVLIFSKKTQKKSAMKHCTLVFEHNITIHDVPLAETLAQQKKGLSGKVNVTQGMFFTFKNPQRLAFWMKDTTTALSIGFFDASGMLLNIEDMEPGSTELYFSASDAASALELPKGQFQQFGLKAGDRLIQKNCLLIS